MYAMSYTTKTGDNVYMAINTIQYIIVSLL